MPALISHLVVAPRLGIARCRVGAAQDVSLEFESDFNRDMACGLVARLLPIRPLLEVGVHTVFVVHSSEGSGLTNPSPALNPVPIARLGRDLAVDDQNGLGEITRVASR